MWKPWLAILSLAAAPVFGQVVSPTLTITATRSVLLQPDDVAFSLTVSSSATASLDQIVAALSGLGVTSANLASVFNGPSLPFQWSFTLNVPIAKLTTTIGSLTELEQNIGQNNSGLALTFTVDGTQASQLSGQIQQSQPCSNSDLIADATAQAQKVAAAAGFTLGPILKLSNAPLSQPTLFVAEASFIGVFSSIIFQPAIQPSTTCSLVVEFQLQ
jgi:hypothetical protein